MRQDRFLEKLNYDTIRRNKNSKRQQNKNLVQMREKLMKLIESRGP